MVLLWQPPSAGFFEAVSPFKRLTAFFLRSRLGWRCLMVMVLRPISFIGRFLFGQLLPMLIVALLFIVYNPNCPISWIGIAAKYELTIWNIYQSVSWSQLAWSLIYRKIEDVCWLRSHSATHWQLVRERWKMKDFAVLLMIALACGTAVGLLTYNFLNWIP